MSKIKLPNGNQIASFIRFMKATNDKPCGENAHGLCNTSTVLTAYALNNAGLNFSFYHGDRCPHGYPTSGGQLAYILDNYAAPAIKAPCDASWKNLLRGSVAILMYQHAFGDPHYNPFDLWCIDGSFHQQILDQGAAKSIWIWTLGNAASPKIKAKHSHHKSAHAPVIF